MYQRGGCRNTAARGLQLCDTGIALQVDEARQRHGSENAKDDHHHDQLNQGEASLTTICMPLLHVSVNAIHH